MLVAVRNLIASDLYGEIRIHRGRTHVAEGSDLALRFPDAFTPAPGQPGARERVAAILPGDSHAPLPRSSDPVATSQRPTVEQPRRSPERPSWFLPHNVVTRLSDTPSRYRVRIASTAVADIRTDLQSTVVLDGREVGAAMYGPRPESWRDVIEVTRAGTLGAHAERTPTSLGRDHAHDVIEGQRIRKQTDGAHREIALWHAHPDGDPTPSLADLRHWSSARSLLGLTLYVGLLATPGERGWDEPQLAAFVVRAADGSDICEPAILI